jgi:hypothetical protein
MQYVAYERDGHLLPLPHWGRFFVDLGAMVAKEPRADTTLVVALALPTRAYAAVLVGIGAVIARVETGSGSEQSDTQKHFRSLSSLPRGTSVTLHRTDGKVVKGILTGCKDFKPYGGMRIGVQVQNSKAGGLTEYYTPDQASRVQVSSKVWAGLPKKQDAGLVDPTKGFASQMFDEAELYSFVTHSALECAIIGNTGLILKESRTTPLAFGANRIAGTPQDILRIRRLFTENTPYRSDVFSSEAAEHPPAEGFSLMRPVVVFDGASAFVKSSQEWRAYDWVVLLDKTESRFDDGARQINRDYMDRKNDIALELNLPLPAGIDMVAFKLTR